MGRKMVQRYFSRYGTTNNAVTQACQILKGFGMDVPPPFEEDFLSLDVDGSTVFLLGPRREGAGRYLRILPLANPTRLATELETLKRKRLPEWLGTPEQLVARSVRVVVVYIPLGTATLYTGRHLEHFTGALENLSGYRPPLSAEQLAAKKRKKLESERRRLQYRAERSWGRHGYYPDMTHRMTDRLAT